MTLPDIPDPDGDDLPEDTIAANKNFYQGLKELKPWSSLPGILKKDNKVILQVEGAEYVEEEECGRSGFQSFEHDH